MSLTYHLSMDEAHTHYFDVEMKIANIKTDSIDIKMAGWTPGSYLVREYARKVEAAKALNQNDNKEIECKKVSKNTWRIYNKTAKNISFSYKVYSFEMTVRTSFLDTRHAFINGASVFMYIDNMQDLSSNIHIKPYGDWDAISTALPAAKKDKWILQSPNFDVLVDSPIQIGKHKVVDFKAAKIPHRLAIIGEGNFDESKMVEDITKIAEACTDIFGTNPCEDEGYTFLLHNTDNNFGGLEHSFSTSLIYPRWSYKPDFKYVRWLGLVAHEYFHLWNIKRIRPAALASFDYERENYTTLLWVAEGVTSYYDDYLLRRAALVDDKKYLGMLAKNITNHENRPGKKVQCLAESSFDAWIKYYRNDENSNNCCVSYYLKGSIVAAMLDLELRKLTDGKKSLDDVMRLLYNDFYLEKQTGFTDAEFRAACNSVGGQNMDAFFDEYVNDVKPIDYNKYLGYVGLKITNKNADSKRLSLDINTKDDKGKLLVRIVKRGGAAYEAGINVHDELIAIDGYRIKNKSNIAVLLERYKVGDNINVTISREGKLQDISVALLPNTSFKYVIEKLEEQTATQKRLYDGWMFLK
ncbi:MAG: M61 family metallopeptidase [Chitinophagales bacterium]